MTSCYALITYQAIWHTGGTGISYLEVSPLGSLTVIATTYDQLPAIAQRILCWAGADAEQVTTSTFGGRTSFRIPESIFAGKGSLVLRRGGTDLLSGYVANTDISTTVNNSNVAVAQAYPSCPASTNQPTILSITTNVGGNPRAITLNYANVAAAGVVNINWGDGTVTNGAAESDAALAHTYPTTDPYGFPRTITVTDASDATQVASATFVI